MGTPGIDAAAPLGAALGGRRHSRRRWPYVLGAVLVALVLALLVLAPAQAKTGHWAWSATGNTPTTHTARFVDDETGETIETIVVPTTSWDLYSVRKHYADTHDGRGAPEGYEDKDNQQGGDGTQQMGQDVAQGAERAQQEADARAAEQDNSGKKISEEDPTFSLSFQFLADSVTKICYNLVSGMVDALDSLSTFFLSVIDTGATPLFTEDFSGGRFGEFYRVASAVASRVGVPFATAMLGVSLGVAMVRASDQRRRNKAYDWAHGMLMLLLAFAVSWTLIYHAVDLCAAIYWCGVQLVRLVQAALSAAGVQSAGAAGAGQALSDSVRGALDGLTYSQGGVMFVVLALALVSTCVCAGCMTYVLGVAFIRMVEIYLRAAFAPITMAFFVGEATRPMGWQYLKRFGAVCFQAGIIMLALALGGLLFSVATTVVTPMVGDEAGVAGALRGLIPAIVCVTSITAIVRKSEAVANGLFGLAG